MKFLIVEDDPNLRLLWRSVVGDLGCEIAEAESLDAAERALHAGGFDAIILDLYLGRDNGLSLAATAEAHNPGCRVIVVTGAADVCERELRGRVGAIASVHRKPVDIEDLARACARLAPQGGRAANG